MESNKWTIGRRTVSDGIKISRQTTQNIYWQTTKTLNWFLIQQTEDVSRTMGSKK